MKAKKQYRLQIILGYEHDIWVTLQHRDTLFGIPLNSWRTRSLPCNNGLQFLRKYISDEEIMKLGINIKIENQ